MQPRIQELISYLDSSRTSLAAAVAAVPESQRDRRPEAGRWSVAEVLEHLALVEGGIGRLLGRQLEAARAAGLGPETSSSPVVPTLPVGHLRDRRVPIAAPERVVPKGELSAGAAWQLLEDRRRALLDTLRAADGLALGEVPMPPHPALGPLDAYQWVVFLGAHEDRHAEQIRECGADGGVGRS